MAQHAELSPCCSIDVYFADAHSPWQPPTNEIGNGLIRRYVGKGTDFAAFSATDLRHIEKRINSMPRRVLGWGTARQVYDQAVATTILTRLVDSRTFVRVGWVVLQVVAAESLLVEGSAGVTYLYRTTLFRGAVR